jgi:hypothetical protein
VGRWPSLAQATGLRATVRVLFAEFLVDPAQRRGVLEAGLSVPR